MKSGGDRIREKEETDLAAVREALARDLGVSPEVANRLCAELEALAEILCDAYCARARSEGGSCLRSGRQELIH